MNIFKIRKQERPLAFVAFIVFTLQNALTVYSHYTLFTQPAKGGFWSIFHNHFRMSGYDDFSYIFLSNGKIYFELSRHPLFAPLLYPFYWLNDALMPQLHINLAVFIMAALLTLAATYSFLFAYRIFNELTGLSRTDSVLLAALLFSFSSIMLAVMVPDHFAFSLLLLLATLYIAGTKMHQHKPMAWWQTALLFFLTAGITLTNGAKTLLAALFTNGRRFFSPRYLFLGVLLPALLLGAIFYWQYTALVLPQQQENKHIEEVRLKKNPSLAQTFAKHEARKKDFVGKPMSNAPLLEWSDTSTPRWSSIVENVFGESIQLHQDHLFEDTFISRPVIVTYNHPIFYVIEGLIVFLFVVALLTSLYSPLLRLCLSWLACDATLHLLLGFALNEVYIMGAHWLFVLPLAYALLLRHLHRPFAYALRIILVLLTLYLFIYNGRLITTQLLSL